MIEQKVIKSKPSSRRYRIAAIVLAILLIGIFLRVPLIFKSMYPSTSEMIIRKAAAAQLHKDPDKLTKKEFEKIEILTFNDNTGLSDITFLKNFTNIKYLGLSNLRFPLTHIPKDTPKWKILLDKLGIIDIPKTSYTPPWMNCERRLIDITPLKKLSKLEKLVLKGTWIKSVVPVTYLENLMEFDLRYNNISDIEPLKKMKNLKTIDLTGCEKVTIEQIQELQEALPKVIINFDYYPVPWLKNDANKIDNQNNNLQF